MNSDDRNAKTMNGGPKPDDACLLSLESDAPEADPLKSEVSFYGDYPWAINLFPTLEEVMRYLSEELRRLPALKEEWQHIEAMTNVFLLSGAITDSVDDYLHGIRCEWSNLAAIPFGDPFVKGVRALAGAVRSVREVRLAWLGQWKHRWDVAMRGLLGPLATSQRPEAEALARTTEMLESLMATPLPNDLRGLRPSAPAAFRDQDLSHFDILALGKAFTDAFPVRHQAIVIVGCRTAGSYFAPLLASYLIAQGYQQVCYLTLRPNRGASRFEARTLGQYAHARRLAVVIDEPAYSGGTLAGAVDLIRKAGFPSNRIVGLLPIHPIRRDWRASDEAHSISDICILSLKPDQYFKCLTLSAPAVEQRLREYFRSSNFLSIRTVTSEMVSRFNSELESFSEGKLNTRLKRVYEVSLQTLSGRIESRYILAKSVGWGWMGYHAFLAAQILSSFVPPILGLRDGILYMEWLRGRAPAVNHPDRTQLVGSLASYVATRAHRLKMDSPPTADFRLAVRQRGIALLGVSLSNAYGPKLRALKRVSINRELALRLAARPTLIDGKMRQQEWIRVGSELVKCDFEQHGLGKYELNVTDPTYDLAESILHFQLSPDEERRLVARYVEESADVDVEERLFLNKLLAGMWTMRSATENLADSRLVDRREEFNQQYLRALDFLVVQTARFCGTLCRSVEAKRRSNQLVVLDVDGVLDRHVFGFPSTTLAGIQAVSVLHAHGIPVVLNTARTLAEVKEYSAAYGFVGGVAEYGAVVWDAASERERVLVSAESLAELVRVREAVRRIPGIFLNDNYMYSLRVYTYEQGRTIPVPTMLVRNLLENIGAHRLNFLQTELDTAIVARESDKGRGLQALVELGGHMDAETIAIGDSWPDLSMFRVANRSFAPAQIPCGGVARRLGCLVMQYPFQLGLLSAVRAIVHQRSDTRCSICSQTVPAAGGLVLGLLKIADESRARKWLRTMMDPTAMRALATK